MAARGREESAMNPPIFDTYEEQEVWREQQLNHKPVRRHSIPAAKPTTPPIQITQAGGGM